MTDKTLTFDEEVRLTRRQVASVEYRALLIWGWTTIAIALAIFALMLTVPDGKWQLLWLALPVIAGTLHVKFQKPALPAPTSLYLMLSSVSRMVIGVIFVCAVAGCYFTYPSYFIVILVLAMWCGVSAFMLDYSRLKGPCVGGFAMAAAILNVSGPTTVAVFMAGVIATLVVPGYIMRSDARKKQTTACDR